MAWHLQLWRRARRDLHELLASPAGARFRHYHARHGARGEPRWQRLLWLLLGVLMVIAGLLASLPPGLPGFVVGVPGLAIIAARFRYTALLLDRGETLLWRLWNRLRPTLKRGASPGTRLGRTLARLAAFDPLKEGEKTAMADPKDRKPGPPPDSDDEVDEASEESFPASDAPSWTPVDHPGSPDSEQHPRKDR